jgi:hypothetical protein
MKSIPSILLILLVSINCFGQSKKLNKLLEKYVSTWASHPPMSLQDSKEIVVPQTFSPVIYTIYAMKWKDIDSIVILDTGGVRIRVELYGNGLQYHLCTNNKDSCLATYFDSLYKINRVVNQISIEIEATNEYVEKGITKKDRRRLIKSLNALNNSPVIIEYEGMKNRPQPKTEPPRKGIIVYMTDHLGQVYIPAKEIQKVKELKTVLSTYKIVSFKFYLTSPGFYDQPGLIYNEGEKFNNEIIRLLQRVRPGTVILFDEILVENGQGKIEQATSFVIVAK